jgi:hypothetical protein
MDTQNRLVELQRHWRPPDGLERSGSRAVRLTAGGKIVSALAVALFAGALAAGIALGLLASRQAEERRLLREQGADTQGRVTRLWRSRDKDRQHWVTYQFAVQGRSYPGRAKLPRSVWTNLQVGSDLPVRYLPSDPALSYPRGYESMPMPMWVPGLVAAALAACGWLATFSIRRQRCLLARGRPAPAVVTRLTRTQHGQTIHYEFPVLSGAIARGRGSPGRTPAAIGATICVLYDPENPRRNAPYPLPLVRPVYRR